MTLMVSTNSDSDGADDNTENDNAKFTVTDTGELKLAAKLNFEQPSGDLLNSIHQRYSRWRPYY